VIQKTGALRAQKVTSGGLQLVKTVLGWVIDTVNLIIHLPPHRVERLWETSPAWRQVQTPLGPSIEATLGQQQSAGNSDPVLLERSNVNTR